MAAKTTVKVAVTNNAAKDDVFTMSEDAALGQFTLDVLANDPGSATLVSAGTPTTTSSTSGQMSLSTTGTFTFRSPDAPATDKTGNLSISNNKLYFDLGGFDANTLAVGQSITFTAVYTAKMANGTLSTANVTVTINGSNDGPVATADVGSVDENGTVAIDVLANDTDIDNGAVLSLVSATSDKGSVSIVDGKVVFSADGDDFDHLPAGVTDTATITYVITDEHGEQATSTVTVTVTGVNDAPTTEVATADVDEDGDTSGQLVAQDLDDGAVLTFTTGDTPTGFVLNEDGSWTFDAEGYDTLAAGVEQDVVVNYTVTDENGASAESTLTITVTGVNDDPTISSASQTGSVTEDGTQEATGQVTADDVDDGDTLTFSVLGGGVGTYGSLTVDEDTGEWKYVLDNDAAQALGAGDAPVETFTIQVDDGNGGTATQEVKITVNGVDEPVTTLTLPDPVAGTLTEGGAGDQNDQNGSTGTPATGIATYSGSGQLPGGTNNANTVQLSSGSDNVNGGNGNDVIYGLAGDDTLNGGADSDKLYGGTGNDNLKGDAADDQLFGGSGSDTLDGGSGADQLTGGFGADVLTGGSGNDRFIYLTDADRGDVIVDYSAGDTVDVSALNIGHYSSGPAANSIWDYGAGSTTINGTTYNGTVYAADTDGDASTIEFWFLSQNAIPDAAFSF